MSKGKNTGRQRSALHRFFLISPKQNMDANVLANKLVSLDEVEEVFLTDGDFGFLVKTRFLKGEEPDNLVRYIERHIGQSYGKVVSYYQYRK